MWRKVLLSERRILGKFWANQAKSREVLGWFAWFGNNWRTLGTKGSPPPLRPSCCDSAEGGAVYSAWDTIGTQIQWVRWEDTCWTLPILSPNWRFESIAGEHKSNGTASIGILRLPRGSTRLPSLFAVLRPLFPPRKSPSPIAFVSLFCSLLRFVFRFVFLLRWRVQRSHCRATWDSNRRENRGLVAEKQGNQQQARELQNAVQSRGFHALREENGAGVGVVDEKIVNARDDTRIVFLWCDNDEWNALLSRIEALGTWCRGGWWSWWGSLCGHSEAFGGNRPARRTRTNRTTWCFGAWSAAAESSSELAGSDRRETPRACGCGGTKLCRSADSPAIRWVPAFHSHLPISTRRHNSRTSTCSSCIRCVVTCSRIIDVTDTGSNSK